MVRPAVNNMIIAVLLLFNLGCANAFWRLLCDGSVGLARMDPLMNYGEVSDHVHSIKGGSGKSHHPSHHIPVLLYMGSPLFLIEPSNPSGILLNPISFWYYLYLGRSLEFQMRKLLRGSR